MPSLIEIKWTISGPSWPGTWDEKGVPLPTRRRRGLGSAKPSVDLTQIKDETKCDR